MKTYVMTQSDVAKALGISRSSVQQLEHSALDKIRSHPGLCSKCKAILDEIDSAPVFEDVHDKIGFDLAALD